MSTNVLIYLGAALVAGLLIAFAAVSIRLVAQRVTASIRARASELLSSYDELLEERSGELKKINSAVARKKEELYHLEQSSARERYTEAQTGKPAGTDQAFLLGVAEKMGTAAYRDSLTAQTYRKIRENFSHDPLDAIRELVPDIGRKGPATLLLEQLSFETVYSLSTLPAEEQRALLRETLDESGRTLLESYTAERRGFGMIGFYDWLKARALSEPRPAVLRVPPAARIGWLPQGITVTEDEDICEGFILEANNQLYDYCVRKSEIS